MHTYYVPYLMVYALYFTVHLRKRKSEHGRLKAPSTSSITYWQIEKDAVPLSGKLSPHSFCISWLLCPARTNCELGRAL